MYMIMYYYNQFLKQPIWMVHRKNSYRVQCGIELMNTMGLQPMATQ